MCSPQWNLTLSGNNFFAESSSFFRAAARRRTLAMRNHKDGSTSLAAIFVFASLGFVLYVCRGYDHLHDLEAFFHLLAPGLPHSLRRFFFTLSLGFMGAPEIRAVV